MKRLISTIRIAAALFLAVFSTNLLPVATAYAAQPVNNTCDDITTPGTGGWTAKFDAGYPDTVSYTAPSGYQVDKYCVKAGSVQQGNGPLIVDVTPPSATVTLDYPGIDSISHYVVHLVATTTQVAIPNPSPVDPCGPGNASWILPADTDSLDWSLVGGVLSVQTKTGYIFTDQTTTKNYGVATDSNVACPPQQVAIPNPSPVDPCGPANASWVLPADTDQLDWTLSGGVLSVQTKAGFVFTDQTTSKSFGVAQDSNTACPPEQVSIPAAPTTTDPCGLNNATWNLPSDTDKLDWSLTAGVLSVQTKAGYVFTDLTTSKSFGLAQDSNVPCENPCDHGCGGGEDKVFVCKYVGTPGVDERLQTGQNPISVSVNSIKPFNGIGSYFTDAQGRSFVLAFDEGQPEPSVSECPSNKKPTVVVIVPVCVDKGQTTPVTVRVTNENSFAVTYKVALQGSSDQEAVIPANSSHDFTFTGYGPGVYKYKVYEKVAVESQSASLAAVLQTSVPQVNYQWKKVWKGSVTIQECEGEERTTVTPTAPTFIEPTCENAFGRVTIPTKTGVVYRINGTVKSAGTYSYPAGAAVVVTAEAASDQYVLSDSQNEFTHTFAAAPTNCVLGDTDVCPNLPGSQTTVPVGSVKNTDGDCVMLTGGQGGGSTLGTSTAVLPASLPATGGDTRFSALFILLASAMAYGVTYLIQGRRLNSAKLRI